jgi:hypothetical protein
LVVGIAMIKSGLTLPQALGMTLVVFAGSAQLAALPLIASGAERSTNMQQSNQILTVKATPFVPKSKMPDYGKKPRLKARKHALPIEELNDRRTLRTVMRHEGVLLRGAKIERDSGEITPHDYKDYGYKRPLILAKTDPPDSEPHWMRTPEAEYKGNAMLAALIAAKRPVQKPVRGRPPSVTVNSLKFYLQDFHTARETLSALSVFEDIVTGAVGLDREGNTRNLNKYQIVAMLSQLDEITSDKVEKWMGCKKRHAQKVAGCLRLIVALAAPLAGAWPKPEKPAHNWTIPEHDRWGI